MEQTTYTLKQVCEMTKLSADQLRNWEKEFNLDIQRSEGGHRRYIKRDVDMFVTINAKLHEQNWSIKQVRAWVNGEDLPVLEQVELQSNLEKKLNQVLEKVNDLEEANKALAMALKQANERSEQFEHKVMERLDERTKQTDLLLTEFRQNRTKTYKQEGFFASVRRLFLSTKT